MADVAYGCLGGTAVTRDPAEAAERAAAHPDDAAIDRDSPAGVAAALAGMVRAAEGR